MEEMPEDLGGAASEALGLNRGRAWSLDWDWAWAWAWSWGWSRASDPHWVRLPKERRDA